jgi:hypothetical protein
VRGDHGLSHHRRRLLRERVGHGRAGSFALLESGQMRDGRAIEVVLKKRRRENR